MTIDLNNDREYYTYSETPFLIIGNIIEYNVLVFVRSSRSLRTDDITPAGMWITHPDNIIRHNHVAGGTHFGFWYRMLEHPEGPSYTPDICPQNAELGEFFNNTVHSVGWYGLWIFEDYFPKQASVRFVERYISLTL